MALSRPFSWHARVSNPPQAPALGSGREADLTLLAALACRDAAVEEQDQRRYESAAQLLIDGIELQQRMGKLTDQQSQLEDALQGLTPFRILDLLSRDLGDQDSHQRGLTLLDELVVARGGLEAADADGDQPGSLSQEDFESFFHCLLYTSPSPRDYAASRMPSSA